MPRENGSERAARGEGPECVHSRRQTSDGLASPASRAKGTPLRGQHGQRLGPGPPEMIHRGWRCGQEEMQREKRLETGASSQ